MNLHHLCSAPQAEIYSDTLNNWLFIDWEGSLTLEVVQRVCLEIARCYEHHPYARVLNSNAQVTSVTPDVAKWLATAFMPALGAIGIECLAWVVAPTLQVRSELLDMVNWLPDMDFDFFDDVESAVAWLQQTAPPNSQDQQLSPSAAQKANLTHLLNHLQAQLLHEPFVLA